MSLRFFVLCYGLVVVYVLIKILVVDVGVGVVCLCFGKGGIEFFE